MCSEVGINEVLLKPRTTCPDCYSRLCSTVCSFHKLFGDKREATMILTPNDILSECTFKDLLDDWKFDYISWMNQSTQDAWYWVQGSDHVWLRTRFRNFLFKMCGCQDLVHFWLRVPGFAMSLRIFKEVCVDGKENRWQQTIQMHIENGRQRSVRFHPHKSDDTNQHHRRILTGKMR